MSVSTDRVTERERLADERLLSAMLAFLSWLVEHRADSEALDEVETVLARMRGKG